MIASHYKHLWALLIRHDWHLTVDRPQWESRNHIDGHLLDLLRLYVISSDHTVSKSEHIHEVVDRVQYLR